MLDAVRRFFGERLRAPSGLESSAPAAPDRVQLAACALLLELAHADGEFSSDEQEILERALVSRLGLDPTARDELLALAEAARAQSLDHYQFTRLIATEYDVPQKMALAEVMWSVILADGRLSDMEAHLVRKMASLMQLDPGHLAQARRSAAARSTTGGG